MIDDLFRFLTLAPVLDWALRNHETLVWTFFFGLIAVSIPALVKLVRQ